MSSTATPKLRWSSVRDCARKAVYEAGDAPQRDRSDREERILWRGRSLGYEYGRFLKQRYGASNVETEVPVKWPLGVGHMDIYLVQTRTAIEVLSSAHASDGMVRSKMLQLVGYIEHADPVLLPVDAGALVILDPTDFTDDVFPIARSSRLYRDLVTEMRDRVAQVQAWAEQGTLPARVCSKPSDAYGHFCLHAEHCFDGWEEPELDRLEQAETVQLVTALHRAKTEERALKGELMIVEAGRKKIEQDLVELVPVGKYDVGPLRIRRTHVQRKPSFLVDRAEAAGVFDPELYAPFFKPGAAYDTWDVERVSSEPLPAAPEDFGDEAPWTAADLEGGAS